MKIYQTRAAEASPLKIAGYKADIQSLNVKVDRLQTENGFLKDAFQKLKSMDMAAPTRKFVESVINTFRNVLKKDLNK